MAPWGFLCKFLTVVTCLGVAKADPHSHLRHSDNNVLPFEDSNHPQHQDLPMNDVQHDAVVVRSLQTSSSTRVVPFDTGATSYSDYWDTTSTHSGNCDRLSEVDAKLVSDDVCTRRGGSCAVGWTQPNEWLTYEFRVGNAGISAVDVVVRAASSNTRKRFQLDLDNGDESVTLNSPGLGLDNYADLLWTNVPVTAGDHTLTISFLNGGINVCAISVYATGGPVPSPSPPTSTSASRVKIYWQPGYFWQEETFERKWCMQCDDNTRGCQLGDSVRIRECDDRGEERNTQLEFVPTDTAGEIILRHPDTSLCLSVNPGTTYARMRSCNAAQISQRWWTAGFGSFADGDRFELHPAGTTDLCLTNHHHPRVGEALYLRPCRFPREATTSYWTKYDP